MTSVRTVVVNALDKTINVRGNPAFAKALVAGEDIKLDDLDIDSLSRMETIMLIEEAFDIEIDDDEVVEQETLNSLISYVEQRIGPAADG
ncbi:acyl carrier protein [Frigidibacter sp. ROC022]|uniref:acyl carrier protein n=1 Tax=Frigidibacter sp. ROC022 TaxID=2971796 RepID=UPI00215A260A|nr:phosphopantetheine-binding protein [Frigidibacter sp. ROC022]MCR8725578.1 phosphopantetheine-binding protein [Frigidibacter sp. ROC022]